MHQPVEVLTEPMSVWELHEPGERHHTSSIDALCRYALAEDTQAVRFVCGNGTTGAEFRIDGPAGRLLWHEMEAFLTIHEVATLYQMCDRLQGQGKLKIV